MRDPQLLAEIEQSHSEFSPLSGDKLQQLVAATADVPPTLVARASAALSVWAAEAGNKHRHDPYRGTGLEIHAEVHMALAHKPVDEPILSFLKKLRYR